MFFEGTSSLAVMRCHQFGTKLSHYGIELEQWPTDIKKKKRKKERTLFLLQTHIQAETALSLVWLLQHTRQQPKRGGKKESLTSSLARIQPKHCTTGRQWSSTGIVHTFQNASSCTE